MSASLEACQSVTGSISTPVRAARAPRAGAAVPAPCTSALARCSSSRLVGLAPLGLGEERPAVGSEQLNEGGNRGDLGEHQRDDPLHEIDLGARDLAAHLLDLFEQTQLALAQRGVDLLDLGADPFDVMLQPGPELLDVELKLRAELLDLLLQAQLALAHVALGGQLREMGMTLFQTLERLGDDAVGAGSGGPAGRLAPSNERADSAC